MSVYPCIFLPFCLFACLSVYVSTLYLSMYLHYIYLSLSVYLSIYVSCYLVSICRPAYLSAYISKTYRSVSLSSPYRRFLLRLGDVKLHQTTVSLSMTICPIFSQPTSTYHSSPQFTCVYTYFAQSSSRIFPPPPPHFTPCFHYTLPPTHNTYTHTP